MSCTRPILAWRSKLGPRKGKWPLVFSKNEGFVDKEVKIPCGRCIGCRLEKSRQWAVRCVNEASCWENNCFVTLTYNDECMPDDRSLDKKVMQKFMKDLRSANDYKEKKNKIRFFLCGEYGEVCEKCGKSKKFCNCKVFKASLGRPHYHLLLFNHDFSDKYVSNIRDKIKVYRSDELERLWPNGYSEIGQLCWESAAYTARYCTKKVDGEKQEEHYKGKQPEFCNMSRKPGIGNYWFRKYHKDVENTDKVIVRNNLQILPPVYYTNIMEKQNPDVYKKIKSERRKKIVDRDMDKDAYLDNVNEVNYKKNMKRRYEK